MDDDAELNLPKVNRHEGLETISTAKFKLMLNPQLFEVREENIRDKGVDVVIELKHRDRYTNFRFVVQLKATATTPVNGDGSMSYPVEVSNIKYLMNYAMPAYYVLFDANAEIFYVEDSQVVNAKLESKYEKGELPDEFSIKFQRVLTPQIILEIHDENYKKGQLMRKLKPFMRFNLENKNISGSFTVNENQEIYSDDEICQYLEKFGVTLINKGKFRRVVELQQKCRGEIGSPFFHFVCGLAYYHLSQLFTALSHFKKADAGKSDFSPEITSLLRYYMQTAKYTLGMISQKEFQSELSLLMESKYLSLFLQVEKSYEKFVRGTYDLAERVKQFYAEMAAIKNDPASDENIKIIVDAQTLVAEGDILNNDLHRKLALMRIIPEGNFLLSDDMQNWLNLTREYDKRTHALRELASKQSNYLAYNTICINYIKVKYFTSVTSKYIHNANEETLYIDTALDEEELAVTRDQCQLLDAIINNYEAHESIENVITTLSLKYELLKFSGLNEDAENAAERMLELIEAYDLNALKVKYDRLINKGTTHELFLIFLKDRLLKMKEETKEFESLKQKIQEMDDLEAAAEKVNLGNCFQIQLMPLGMFKIPKNEVNRALEILHVFDQNAKSNFLAIWEMGIMPIANVHNDPIVTEGPVNGAVDFQGLDSMRNIYRIRAAFYDNKFLKIKRH